ncbi:stearoyl-CoA desaturase 5 isoform X2 [Trachypithecus francoisi]|uniref:stearoyl-CoA desaturase 5 isoform X2 n=1 Tax=Trachypithecus francoisi TaxID=54180 RepID=UPI00141ADEFD|nr:stearoyl-CoA desaturase 5 isoform X2 [Trachypithecus francoisi]
MPGPATDAGKIPFCDAKEEIRAGLESSEGGGGPERPGARGYRQNIVWRNVVLMSLLHLGAVYSLVLIPKAKPLTLLWAYFCFLLAALGVTAGAHRLWSHRSYKAKLPLRIFLAIANSMAFQNDIFEWSRDHRAHHKYSETDADPHNARRGFFFSHIGWLFVRKHPDVIEKGRKLDVTDLLADPVVRIQRNTQHIQRQGRALSREAACEMLREWHQGHILKVTLPGLYILAFFHTH